MSRAHFHVLDVRAVVIDAGPPGHDCISARVNGGDRRAQQDSIAQFDLRFHGVHIDPAAMKLASDNRIFRTADNGSSQGYDPLDKIRSISRCFPCQVSAQAPADEVYRLS